MTLPASPPITLGQVCTEFGAPLNTALGAFLRGGAWVPNTAGNAGVPTSLPISLGQLCGASKLTLTASAAPASLSKTITSPGTATTAPCTVTVSGSSGTATYAWSRVSGDTATTINSSTTATVSWSGTVNTLTPSRVSTWNCKVSDASGNVTTNNVTVDLEYAP